MDACHVLLGRPWLFDCRVIHDGYQNTYTLIKDGQKITVAHLAAYQISKPKTKEEPQGGEIFLSLLKPTLLDTHHEYTNLNEMILFTPPQEDQSVTPVYLLATQPLQTFSHVFPKEIHFGLLP